jgi:SAM-dependent methyltransferase
VTEHAAPGTGSYRFAQEGVSAAAELVRLEAQVELTWARELRLLRMLGVVNGADMVELGCGPGFLLRRLAAAFPGSRCTGVDSDPAMLELARAAAGAMSVQWVNGDAAATTLPDGCCDVALARYLFQHLARPADAAAEMMRLLRPGGRGVVIDVDQALWGIAEPTFPEVIPIHIRHGRAQGRRGGDQRVGRRLWRILRDAGFSDVQLDLVAVHSDETGIAAFAPQLDPHRMLISVRDGILSEADMDVLRSAHDRFMSHPDAWALMVICVASGVRPS